MRISRLTYIAYGLIVQTPLMVTSMILGSGAWAVAPVVLLAAILTPFAFAVTPEQARKAVSP